ncbi:unnamed protein product [Miscanthus lutarioriparius]|uniref:Uncharacterized protein n=1 Tax=Miscanthus lutarioriparius TaxID=422564 RepID=A0A811NG53_9POAL|nr:unnamed protein product [Miscanthus lutarioriparius]
MSRLQRSSVSFRRQGSSGRIWDDPLRGLDLKGLSTTPKAAPLHHDASVLAGDPSPRVVSRSLMRHSGGGGGAGGASSAGVIVESPEVAASASPAAASVVVKADGGKRQERPARRRRRISAAFCACMGHPPASHAQQ